MLPRLAKVVFNRSSRKAANVSEFVPKLSRTAWSIPLAITLYASSMTFAIAEPESG